MDNNKWLKILILVILVLIIGTIVLFMSPKTNNVTCTIKYTSKIDGVELNIYAEGENATLKDNDGTLLNTTHYITHVTTNGKYTYYVTDGKTENSCSVEINSIKEVPIEEPTIGKITANTMEMTDSLTLTLTANDGINLAKKPYSWDKKNWSKKNTLKVTKNGTYIGYIKDEKGNISEIKYKVSNIRSSKIKATGISLNINSVTVKPKESVKLIFTLTPSDANDYKVTWSSSNPNVAIVDISGKVTAIKAGSATIKAELATGEKATCTVKVEESVVAVTDIKLNTSSQTINVGKTVTLTATINPTNATNKTVTWSTSDSNVATVLNGVVTGKKAGTAIITASSSNGKTAKATITVKGESEVAVTSIKLNKSNSTLIKGQTETLTATLSPSNATNKTVTWSSSNTGVVSVKNGKITAVTAGTATITAKTNNGKTATCTITVNPKTGLISGTGGIWGYTASNEKTPDRADSTFFQIIANNGKGSISGNIYTYTTGGRTYKYNISNSTLSVDGKSILMRIYYPSGFDLSTANTFTFMGGTSEQNMGGYFSHLDQNRSEMKTTGIIILVSSTGTYVAEHAVYATDFVKAIVGQKSGVKNTVGGYSLSGEAAGNAANIGSYNRLIIFCSKFHADLNTNVINKEVVVYSPKGDKMSGDTTTTLNYLVIHKYTNVILVTNNSTIYNISKYTSNFLVINPGSQMGSGHVYANISTAKVFSYACS